MSCLYKRLAKLAEIASKKDIKEKSVKELKYARTRITSQQKANE